MYSFTFYCLKPAARQPPEHHQRQQNHSEALHISSFFANRLTSFFFIIGGDIAELLLASGSCHCISRLHNLTKSGWLLDTEATFWMHQLFGHEHCQHMRSMHIFQSSWTAGKPNRKAFCPYLLICVPLWLCLLVPSGWFAYFKLPTNKSWQGKTVTHCSVISVLL